MLKPRIEKTHHTLITDGVPEHEQTLMASKPFWVLFVANLGVGTWLMGVLVAKMHLDTQRGLVALFIGSVVGSILPALTALLGPRSRLSQMEAGRFSLGKTGKKIPAVLNWVGAIGWDVINNLISASALLLFLSEWGIDTPFWLALAFLVVVQAIIGVYGHHMIQETSRFTGILLAFFFIVIGILSMKVGGLPHSQGGPPPRTEFLSALILITIYNISGWTTYTADYTRYLPKNTASRHVFLGIFLALFLSLALLGFFGYMTASTVEEETPRGVMLALQKLTGSFSPLVLLLVGFSAIPANAVNDNSAAYSLISSGFRVSRPSAAVIGALSGFLVCLLASHAFIEFYENFLLLFAHWIAPWAAVILVHWFINGKKELKTPPGITAGCVIFFLVSIASLLLFSSNPVYSGPVPLRIGGLDIGPFFGFVTAGVLYFFLLTRQTRGGIEYVGKGKRIE